MIEPVLLVSDTHFAKRTITYNHEVTVKRFEKLAVEVGQVCKGLDKITIVNLGDNNDGYGIYPTQQHHQDTTDTLEQVDPMLDILLDLSTVIHEDSGARVDWKCVAGNHGRVGGFGHENTNWDVLLYKLLQRESRDLDWLDVDMGSPEQGNMFLRRFKINNTDCLAYHGDGIRCYSGFPRYGIANRVKNWLTTDGLRRCHYIFMGHFHCCEYFHLNDVEVYVNGTMVSDDEWALEKLGYKSEPRWWLLLMEDGKVVAERRIMLR